MDARAVATAFLPGSLGRLAALYSDGSVSIYTEDAAQAPTVVAISGRPTVSDSLGLAISPDGERIALSDSLGIRIQRLESGDALSLSVISGCSSGQLRFSAEGSELIGWGMDALCAWRVADGALLQTLTGQFASAGMAGGRLVTWEVGSSHIKSRNLGEAVTQERELVLPVGTELVLWTQRVSPRVDSFAAVARSGEHFWGNVWSAAGELQSSIPLDPKLALSEVSYSPSGNWILLGGQLVDVGSGERRSTFLADTTRDEPFWKVDDSGLRLGGLFKIGHEPAGVELARALEPGKKRIIGSLPKSAAGAFGGWVRNLAVSPDGTRLVTSGSGVAAHTLLWNVDARFERSAILGHLSVELTLDIDFSPDGKWVAVSGEGWGLFPTEAEGAPVASTPIMPEVAIGGCWFKSARFSNHGAFLARGSDHATVDVSEADLGSAITSLPTRRCNGRASFSSNDTLLATSGPELYRTSDWSRVWPQTIVPAPVAEGAASSPLFDDARFAPDDQALLLSSCARLWEECRHELRDLNGSFIRALPELTGPRAQFSPEGHWALSADTLLHLPTNERRYLKGRVMASTFTPNGDVVGLLEDNTIVRYCRTAPKP